MGGKKNKKKATEESEHGHSHGGVPCDGDHGPRHGEHGHSHGGVPCDGDHEEHGHSHGGVPCDGDHGEHGHSHGGVPCDGDHGHGGHGHSHGGVPCDGDHGGHGHSHGAALGPFHELTVRTRQPGTGRTFPQDGNALEVHYDGFLASKPNEGPFDSSRRRGPLQLTLGSGQVIAGWEDALRQMSVGELAVAEIPASQAYGAEGRPPVIPPNADLLFQMQLASINGKTREDLEKWEGELNKWADDKIKKYGKSPADQAKYPTKAAFAEHTKAKVAKKLRHI